MRRGRAICKPRALYWPQALRSTSLVAILAALVLALGATNVTAAPEATLGATYSATVPTAAAAGATLTIPVTLTNTGDEIWKATGPNPVNLSYHWYDQAGATAVWEGVRTPLGADVAPGTSRSVTASVLTPQAGGLYQLRLHLVREGQAWFPLASPPFAVQVQTQYAARFGSAPVQSFLADATVVVPISVTNVGTLAWNAAGANPITLSYHWHDARGATVVWDGLRTPLPNDVAPGATVVINAQVRAPAAGAATTLTFDLVREGVGWFQAFGGTTPLRTTTVVAPPIYTARYDVPATLPAVTGDRRTVPVTVTNTGNVPWPAGGPNPVNIAYHLFDSAGRTVSWEGTRTPLGTDLLPGQSRTLQLAFTAPSAIDTYSLNVDAVREGISWFSGYGVPAGGIRLVVTSGFSVGYAATTTPLQATIGAALELNVEVVNYGPRTLSPAGPNPVNLSYHITNGGGGVIVWDGRRGILPRDLVAGQSVIVPITIQLPSVVGDYRVQWDMVQEGIAWLSHYGVQMKVESVSVQPGVTFYGKGFGHGVGMSQYGAQGLATGAAGRPRTGEEIVQHYYTGSTVGVMPPPGNGIRVLLSAPSSQGRFNCSGTAYMDTWLANVSNPSGFRVLLDATNAELARAAGGVTWQIAARNGVVQVWNNGTNPPTKVHEGGPVVIVPTDAKIASKLAEKGIYRGNLRFANLGNTLRAVNFLSYDDYLRGVVPLEMPTSWHPEAYKAQALAARSYAFMSYKGGQRDYDVTDDQSDQCYGGVQLINNRVVETAVTNAAIDATLGKVIISNGKTVQAFFSASSGGYTLPFGCWGANVTRCAESPTALGAVADPADVLVTQPTINRHANWSATYTSSQIRAVVANMRGIDIGTLLAVDLSNRLPRDVGHAVSIVIRGTNATVEVGADAFFRGQLGLKSTMVRLSPW